MLKIKHDKLHQNKHHGPKKKKFPGENMEDFQTVAVCSLMY